MAAAGWQQAMIGYENIIRLPVNHDPAGPAALLKQHLAGKVARFCVSQVTLAPADVPPAHPVVRGEALPGISRL